MKNKLKIGDITEEGLEVISEQSWIDFLSEENFNPDYWCDICPEDYGYIVYGDDNYEW